MTATRFPLTSYTSPRCPGDNGLQEYKLWLKTKHMALNFLRALRVQYMLQRSAQRIECMFCRKVKLQKPQMAYCQKNPHSLTEIMVWLGDLWMASEKIISRETMMQKELTNTSKGNHLTHFQCYMRIIQTQTHRFWKANPTHLEQSFVVNKKITISNTRQPSTWIFSDQCIMEDIYVPDTTRW